MTFQDFQDGCPGRQLGYRYRPILAILNLHVTPMPPTKFGLRMILATLNLYAALMPPTVSAQFN